MDSKQKFEKFLESLKGKGQDTLIESVKKGFQVCMEGSRSGLKAECSDCSAVHNYSGDDNDIFTKEFKCDCGNKGTIRNKKYHLVNKSNDETAHYKAS